MKKNKKESDANNERKRDYGAPDLWCENSGCDCPTYWGRNTVAHLDAMQFSKRAVIVTFTVCGTAGWTLLLFETLGGRHSGREAVIMEHARQMAKCHVAWVSSSLLCFTQALYKLEVNRVLLNQTVVGIFHFLANTALKTLSGGLALKTQMGICNYCMQTVKWLTQEKNVWIYPKLVLMFNEYSLSK